MFLNCPSLSKYQWHPFTITSSPEEKYLSCHIKGVGTWTKGLNKLLNPGQKMGHILIDKSRNDQGQPLLRVDGPFGAPSEHVWDSRVAVLIGAGIGVTPYASILKSMFYKLLLAQAAPKEYHLELMRVQKVHFYWICRDRSAFEWFAFLLRDLEVRSEGFLEVHTYITDKFKLQEIESYVDTTYRDPSELDALTGLKTRTYFGRPDFDSIFQDMCSLYPKEKVGVFFCGPKVMSSAIKRAAAGASTPAGTQFVFRKENF
jgi:NADPH oxidase